MCTAKCTIYMGLSKFKFILYAFIVLKPYFTYCLLSRNKYVFELIHSITSRYCAKSIKKITSRYLADWKVALKE